MKAKLIWNTWGVNKDVQKFTIPRKSRIYQQKYYKNTLSHSYISVDDYKSFCGRPAWLDPYVHFCHASLGNLSPPLDVFI